jgi:hypothetical protein
VQELRVDNKQIKELKDTLREKNVEIKELQRRLEEKKEREGYGSVMNTGRRDGTPGGSVGGYETEAELREMVVKLRHENKMLKKALATAEAAAAGGIGIGGVGGGRSSTRVSAKNATVRASGSAEEVSEDESNSSTFK